MSFPKFSELIEDVIIKTDNKEINCPIKEEELIKLNSLKIFDITNAKCFINFVCK